MRVMLEFQCPECNHYQESLVQRGEVPDCPHGHGPMKKLISTPTFHFTNGVGTDGGNAYAFRGRPLWGGTD